MTTATAQLTRAEDAYAHLASFQRGDMVTVTHRAFTIKGTVTEPQRDGSSLLGAYLTVEDYTERINTERAAFGLSPLAAGTETTDA